MDVNETLKERGHVHGNFDLNAKASQALKLVIKEHNLNSFSPAQQEGLDNICQKIARILVGNPDHTDHWHDIAGYATLVEKSIIGEDKI
jgi:hypothetical protein